MYEQAVGVCMARAAWVWRLAGASLAPASSAGGANPLAANSAGPPRGARSATLAGGTAARSREAASTARGGIVLLDTGCAKSGGRAVRRKRRS